MAKHRTSVEFPPELWNKLSHVASSRKKSKYIMEAIKEKLKRESLRVVVLCGGEGTRMRPLTLSTSKAMLPLGYKPLLEHTIDYWKAQGVHDFILSIGYFSEQIIKYFGSGSRFDVDIEYSSERSPLGTGGAIKAVENLINSTFIVVFGDTVFSELDLKSLLDFHRTSGAAATMVVWRAKGDKDLGVVQLEDGQKESGRVKKFVGKPKRTKGELINAGIFVFEPEIFRFIPANRAVSLEDEVLPVLVQRGMLFAYEHKGYWADIGVPSDYAKVCKDFFNGRIK